MTVIYTLQGGILSQILYSLYTSDIPEQSCAETFADDYYLLSAHKNLTLWATDAVLTSHFLNLKMAT